MSGICFKSFPVERVKQSSLFINEIILLAEDGDPRIIQIEEGTNAFIASLFEHLNTLVSIPFEKTGIKIAFILN